jgi:hypothetical protein
VRFLIPAPARSLHATPRHRRCAFPSVVIVNPKIRVERRMTLEAFIRNNKNYGKEIRCAFLFLPRPDLSMPHRVLGRRKSHGWHSGIDTEESRVFVLIVGTAILTRGSLSPLTPQQGRGSA